MEQTTDLYNTLLVPVDRTDDLAALPLLRKLSRHADAEVVLLHNLDDPGRDTDESLAAASNPGAAATASNVDAAAAVEQLAERLRGEGISARAVVTRAAKNALAIREETFDLEKAGIRVIQIDEAALREGLPLRRSQWRDYLDWAIESFRIAANGVADETQVHTHMCYSEFNDIIESIAAMDADVITIETSRSDMELLDVFDRFQYPNEIGPGVYDIHSPNVPTVEQIVTLMKKAAERIPLERLWVNPDCGLKTRQWEEVLPALTHMVAAAKELRESLVGTVSS